MSHSQLDLEGVEALYLGPSYLMADPMGPLLDQDEEALSPSSSLEGTAPASPPPSFSSDSSSLSPYHTFLSSPLSASSPPPSPSPTHHPSSILGTKSEADSLSFPWLSANNLLNSPIRADDDKDDAFAGMEWMCEKIDLSDFDLDSLIGSCSSDESPSSPEDLLASLHPHMDLDLESLDAAIPAPHEELEPSIASIPVVLGGLAEAKQIEMAPDQEVDMTSEPSSPAAPQSPPSQASPMELQSEVEKTATSLTATIIQEPTIQTSSSILFSLPTSRFLVLLTNKEEPPLMSPPDPSPLSSDSDSDSGIESVASSPSHLPSSPPPRSPSAGSSRTKPYSKPDSATSSSAKASKVKSVSGAPKVVEKKLKKMEQNKTAATRYRQKKRVEQEQLNVEREELEKRNHELAEKVESISKEIQYLKDLMEEVRKHRRGKTTSVASTPQSSVPAQG
ncbi:cyclic AMP-dependent transcription factor ATF-4 [Aulostomus maculatus]